MDKTYNARLAIHNVFVEQDLNSEEALVVLLQQIAQVVVDHTNGPMSASHVRGWCDAELGKYLEQILDAKYPKPQVS